MNRIEFLKAIGLGTLAMGTIKLSSFAKSLKELPESGEKMPVLFCGHGSPMNAIEDNDFTKSLEKLAAGIPTPRAILCISAHWLTRGTYVNGSVNPKMIYDFSGFPQELYKVQYPSHGSPALAKEVQSLVKKTEVKWDTDWGYDHGTWAILRRLYPKADIPLFQMSIDYYKPAQYHYDLARELTSLREKGVLIIGSGNITHNLSIFDFSDINAKPFDWAVEFDEKIKDALLDGNYQALIDYRNWGKISKLAHPTPDHYYPLIYSIALREKNETITFPYEGFHHASASMRCVRIG
ncbi:MAG: 4,5-DOPA dioxygenase extradiol [Bacteroidetes bacterium]|nr:4,5-DOPA dioxygenase extradiol [Bacteroidota bacterium]